MKAKECIEILRLVAPAADFAIEAVEKSVAEVPNQINLYGNEKIVGIFLHCPRCEMILDEDYKYAYCPWCGQHIDWKF